MKKTNLIAYTGVLSALAIVFGYLEQMIPMPVAVPGIKLGLSNICVLIALYALNKKCAFGTAVIKALVCGILFWGVSGMLYALAGSLLAFCAMALGKGSGRFGVVGVSVLGAVFHNVGQLIVLRLLSGSFSVVYYVSVLGVAACVTGTLTGIVAALILRRIKNLK